MIMVIPLSSSSSSSSSSFTSSSFASSPSSSSNISLLVRVAILKYYFNAASMSLHQLFDSIKINKKTFSNSGLSFLCVERNYLVVRAVLVLAGREHSLP